MNWATIAPETRLYKGKNLYRWEDSPGLEHHCGTCATPLHNARAKTSCIGTHVEPCYRFHQQLHFVGKSHECFGCNSSDEMHHNRHKEILKVVRQITTIDQEGSMLPPGRLTIEGKVRRESATTVSTDTATDTTSESAGTEESKKTRRERKKAKKTGNLVAKIRRDIEAFPKEETDFISAAIHGTVHESKGAWEGSYVYDHKRPALETSAVVDEEEEEAFHEGLDAITASVHDLAVKLPNELTPRQRKCVKMFSTPISHSSYGGGSRKFSTHHTNQRADPYDGVDPAIFFRLGIEIINPAKNSKARKDLVVKLVTSIKEDIEIIEREDKESIMREEGFWRWAGKTAYHAIAQTRTELDWATGQKKGTPRPFEYPQGEIGVDFSEDEDEPKMRDPKPVVPKTPKKEIPVKVPVNERISPVWETVVSKKTEIPKKKPKPTKNFRTLSLKPATNPFDIVEDEEGAGAEDVDEMVSRYQQRKAGERTVGRVSVDAKGDHRTGGRKLTLKVK